MVDIDRIISERIEMDSPYFLIKKSYFKKGRGSKSIMRQLGNEFKSKLVHSIEQQVLPMKPLSPKYREYKKRNLLDPRKLIATGEYIDSIDVTEDGEGNIMVAPNNKRRDGTTITNRDLGKFLEYGTARMPKRPHWKPTIKAFKKTILKKVKDYVNNI